MSTYLDLQSRVASDYLNRTDYTSEVKRSLLAAIRYYERRRWQFNQTSTALTTSAGQTYVSLPSNFLVLDDFRITYAGATSQLLRRDIEYILDMRTVAVNAVPTDYCLYGNKLELALTPDSAYSCPLYYLKSLTELSADTDTNSWTQGAMQDLIVYHATKLMWSNVIRNDSEAMKYQMLEQTVLTQVTSEFEQFEFHGLKPTEF